MNDSILENAMEIDWGVDNDRFPVNARLFCVFTRKIGRREVHEVRILDGKRMNIRKTDTDTTWYADTYTVRPHSMDIVLGNFGEVEGKSVLLGKPMMEITDPMRGVSGHCIPITKQVEDALISVNRELGISSRHRKTWRPAKQFVKWFGYAIGAYAAAALLYILANLTRIHP